MMRVFAVVAFPISGELMSIILCCSSLQTFDIPFQVFIFIMLSLDGKLLRDRDLHCLIVQMLATSSQVPHSRLEVCSYISHHYIQNMKGTWPVQLNIGD